MTKAFPLIIVIGLGTTTAAVAVDDCEGDPGSTRFQSCVYHQSFKKLDDELNELYQRKLGALVKRGAIKERAMLVSAQRAWVHYKDETCKFEQESIGAAYSKNEVECQARLTSERVEYLKHLDQ